MDQIEVDSDLDSLKGKTCLLSAKSRLNIRAQALCNLTLDVNLGQNKIKMRHGKGDKGRTVRFGKRTAKAAWEYLKDRIDSADSKQRLVRVEELSDPHAMNRHVLRRLLKRIDDRVSVKNVHPHRLRHSFATEYLCLGGKMLALQELWEHADLEMVRRYAKFVEADIALDHAIASRRTNCGYKSRVLARL